MWGAISAVGVPPPLSGFPNEDVFVLTEGVRGVSGASDGTDVLTREGGEGFLDVKVSFEREACSFLVLGSVGEVSLGDVKHFSSLVGAFFEGLCSCIKPAMEATCGSWVSDKSLLARTKRFWGEVESEKFFGDVAWLTDFSLAMTEVCDFVLTGDGCLDICVAEGCFLCSGIEVIEGGEMRCAPVDSDPLRLAGWVVVEGTLACVPREAPESSPSAGVTRPVP